MSAVPPSSPVQRFLGEAAAAGGAIGLLGLTPESCTPERVLASLEWQLDRVAQHAEGDTPEADEVRLALHAAAAQLLDPNVRQVLAGQLGSIPVGAAPPSGAAQTVLPPSEPRPAQAAPQSNRPIPPSVAAEASKIVAHQGGLNPKSIEMLSWIAEQNGVAIEALVASLRTRLPVDRAPRKQAATLNGQGRAQNSSRRSEPAGPHDALPAGAQSEAGDSEPADEADPATRYIRNALILGGAAFLALVCFLIFMAVLLSAPTPTGSRSEDTSAAGRTPSPQPKAQASEKPTTPAPAPTPARAKPERVDPDEARLADPKAVVRTLRECAAQAAKEPEQAALRFGAAVKAFSNHWARFDPAERRAADSGIVDCVYATSTWPEASARIIDDISAGSKLMAEESGCLKPSDVPAAAWSVGTLTRLLHERELPNDISTKVESALAGAIGQERMRFDSAFEGGAIAALRRMPALLLCGTAQPPPPSGPAGSTGEGLFATWIEAVGGVSGSDADQRERILIDGLEAVMAQGPEPGADRRVYGVIQDLVVQIKWRKGGPARARLMDWFSDPRMSNADIQVLTSALATRSSAEGVDQTMVLSSGATSGDRQRLRASYAKAWGMAEAAGRNKLAADWVRTAKRELVKSLSAGAPLDMLESTVTLSELSEAAVHLWRGETEPAERLVKEAGESAAHARTAATRAAQKIAGVGGEGDGRWTVSYLSAARNIPVRLERLKELENSTVTIGVVDAGLLAELACRESPTDVKAAAQQLVERFAAQAVMVNAVLAYLPQAPKYSSVGAVIEHVAHKQLPKVTEPHWEMDARRALVERLLEMVAAGGDQGSVDGLATLLGESYQRRAGVESNGQSAPLDPALAVSRSAKDLWKVWRTDAQAASPNQYAPLSLDEIDGRRHRREALNDGPVQSLAVDQVGIAELMAYIVTAEHPARAAKARSILGDMSAGRRKATHVFGQLAATERAILELWMLRLSEDGQ